MHWHARREAEERARREAEEAAKAAKEAAAIAKARSQSAALCGGRAEFDDAGFKASLGAETGAARQFFETTFCESQLFDVFMGTHDPTQLNRQGNDVGTQYRSAIFPLDGQEDEARAAIGRWNDDHPGQQAVTTIESGQWYPAEDYHQEYWEGEGQRNPYCQAVIPPKLMKLRKSFQKYLKADA